MNKQEYLHLEQNLASQNAQFSRMGYDGHNRRPIDSSMGQLSERRRRRRQKHSMRTRVLEEKAVIQYLPRKVLIFEPKRVRGNYKNGGNGIPSFM